MSNNHDGVLVSFEEGLKILRSDNDLEILQKKFWESNYNSDVRQEFAKKWYNACKKANPLFGEIFRMCAGAMLSNAKAETNFSWTSYMRSPRRRNMGLEVLGGYALAKLNASWVTTKVKRTNVKAQTAQVNTLDKYVPANNVVASTFGNDDDDEEEKEAGNEEKTTSPANENSISRKNASSSSSSSVNNNNTNTATRRSARQQSSGYSNKFLNAISIITSENHCDEESSDSETSDEEYQQ